MTTTDPFAKYVMPLGLKDGVKIPLPDTGAVFTVMLPSAMNEDFNTRMLSELNAAPDEEGNIRVDTAVFQSTRKRLFLQTCVLDAVGLPDGMTVEEFFNAYPLAARFVFERATEMSVDADNVAQEALGKSKTTLNGKGSGEEKQNSTTKLSSKESTSKQDALI